jgi:hypothetical protein
MGDKTFYGCAFEPSIAAAGSRLLRLARKNEPDRAAADPVKLCAGHRISRPHRQRRAASAGSGNRCFYTLLINSHFVYFC